MAGMRDQHKNQGESPLAGQQNGDGSSSFGFAPVYTESLVDSSPSTTDYYSPPRTKDPRTTPTMNSEPSSPTDSAWSSTPTWVTTTKTPHYHYSVETIDFPLPTSSDWDPIDSSQNHGPLHPAFVVAPIVGFVIIVGLLYACLRNRRQRSQAMAAQANAEEMTMQQPRSIYPYNAPPLETSTQFSTSRSFSSPTATPTLPPPVILGPILTGADSSYLTGIDTSEEAAMVLDEPTANPFADNNVVDNDDVSEPPPPYRPRSVALPSFTAASQTHLVERSPFDDPQDAQDDDDNADAISELSEPMGERDNDAMSAVSDLSYQHDADVSRTNV